jgi:hypothetical protein
MPERRKPSSDQGTTAGLVSDVSISGMTGNLRLSDSLRRAVISLSCHRLTPCEPKKTAADFTVLICSPRAVDQEFAGLISASSRKGLIPSLTNCCAISRTAGLSSLLWHRKTSKISVLGSWPFTQRQFYGKTRPDDNKLRRLRISIPSGSVIPTPEQKQPVPDHECNRSEAYPASSPARRSWMGSMWLAPKQNAPE